MDPVKTILEIVNRISPHLRGHPPEIQSAVIAELTALWLSGHHPSVRDKAMLMHDGLVADLVKVNSQRIWGS